MAKYCPPGVICIENMTLVVVFILILVVGYVIYIQVNKPDKLSKIVIQNTFPEQEKQADVLLNPYTAPLTNQQQQPDSLGIPINIRTQGRNTSYSQVGILTRVNGPETILPLMGRELIAGRDKQQYYTISDQNNSVKLPVSKNGKSCTGEYGCDSLYNGDTVYVEGYNDAFKVTMYESGGMQYIPYI